MDSAGGTPRDERFYTPRAYAHNNNSSSDGEFFTPRYVNGQLIASDQRSDDGGSEYQTPRSARADEQSFVRRSVKDANKSAPSPRRPNYSQNAMSPVSEHDVNGSFEEGLGYESYNTAIYDGYQDEGVEVLGVEDPVTAEDVEDIFRYARHGRCEEMEKLLDLGIPVDIRDEYGSTLLIVACQNGNKKIAKSALRRGANINARNFKGNTALHYCYHCRSYACCRRCVYAGDRCRWIW